MTAFALPQTAPELLADISAARDLSDRARPQASPDGDNLKQFALGSWRRADSLVRSVASLASEAPPNLDVLGQIARTLWEGMTTIEYVRQRPEIRVQQLLVAALRTSRLVLTSQWGREKGVRDLDDKPAQLIAKATNHEKAYRKKRRALEQAGKTAEPFDHDQCAALPSVEVMARHNGTHDQYEVVYRMESARATHWGLHAVASEDEPETRLLQAMTTIAGCYRVILANCAQLLGLDHGTFLGTTD